MNLDHIKNEVQKFNSDRNWSQFHSPKNLAMALSVECSELLEIFQWMTELESNQVKEDPLLKNRVSEEVADVFLYLLQFSMKLEIDLEENVLKKIKKNAEKYPIEKIK